MTKEQIKIIEAKIKELQYKVEKLKKEDNKFWKPKYGEAIYILNITGVIFEFEWVNSTTFINYLEQGHVFKTKEEAEHERERRKIIKIMRDYSKPVKIGQANWFIEYNCDGKFIDIDWDDLYIQQQLVFESEEVARKVIDEIGEERLKKYYFRVE